VGCFGAVLDDFVFRIQGNILTIEVSPSALISLLLSDNSSVENNVLLNELPTGTYIRKLILPYSVGKKPLEKMCNNGVCRLVLGKNDSEDIIELK